MKVLRMLCLLTLICFAMPALAQVATELPDEPVVVEQPAEDETGESVAQPEEPLYALTPVEVRPDRNIFRRAPVIDGRIEPGEWDTFYMLEIPGLKATTFADWTSDSLYFAARADRPIDLLILLDGNNDGWFHGSDNYQIKALRPGAGGPNLEILRYDSRSARQPGPQPLAPDHAGAAVMKATVSDGEYVVELALPRTALTDISLRSGARIGLRMAVRSGDDEASWIPSVTLGDVEECTLAETKSAALDPLEIHLQMRDARVTPGEELQGRLFLLNHGSEPIEAGAFVIGGEGKAAHYLNSEMIRLDGLQPNKLVRHTFKSRVPANMPEGYWAIGAELKVGGGRIGGALASFEVVKPYEITLQAPSATISSGNGWQRVALRIRNNTSRPVYGQATIKLPEGWQVLKSLYSRKFYIQQEDGVSELRYSVKPPEGVKPGAARLSAEVVIDKETLEAFCEVAVD